MVWRLVEKELNNSLNSSSIYWSPNLPKIFKRSIYLKDNRFKVRFELIPELWNNLSYYWYFNKHKNYYHPRVNNIKFFYFTSLKKNVLLFLISSCVIYKNCFLELLTLIIKSLIIIYLILYSIYLILFMRKLLYIYCNFFFLKYLSISILIVLNNFINFLFKNTKKKWYF
jgi:hypothetical protein